MPVLASLLFFALIAFPQQEKPNLLVSPVHLAGTVVDVDGKPIPETRIAHTHTKDKLPQTDAEGHFAFDTDAPAVVFQKPGFRSLRIQVRPAVNIRVTLHPVPRKLPTCTDHNQLVGMNWGEFGGLYFHTMKGIKATKPTLDVDALYRNYYIASVGKGFAIQHGIGPLWGSGDPFDEDVWRSTYFEEVSHAGDLNSIIDARGQLPDGTRWRNLGAFGNSAFYHGVTPQVAERFDKFLDTVCMVPAKPLPPAPTDAQGLVPVSEPK